MDLTLTNNVKSKAIAYMSANNITIESLAQGNNLNVDELAEYFSQDSWSLLTCKFFYEELGEGFQAYLLK